MFSAKCGRTWPSAVAKIFLKNQAVSSFPQWIIFYFGKFNFSSIIQKEGQLFTNVNKYRSCYAFFLLYKTFSTVTYTRLESCVNPKAGVDLNAK